VRLSRQRAPAREPGLHACRPAIVGGGRQTQIAEALAQIGKQFGRFRDRLLGIERIGEPALGRRSGHELCDALRACAARDAGPEAAFLPDQPREEIDRHAARCRGAFDHAAQGLIDGFVLPRRNRRWHGRQPDHGKNRKSAHGCSTAFLGSTTPATRLFSKAWSE